MICVIADDITGAAEMAGIAHRLGLSVALSLDGKIPDGCDVAVVATDTRSLTEVEAVAETRRVLTLLKEDGRMHSFFKKADSALRGHVVAELSEMIDILGVEGALYLPANPSKGRTISEGQYLIDGVPIDKTDFSFDPEFPAFSALLAERFPDADARHVQFADAVTGEDMEAEVERAMSENLLLAGAADLFTAFIRPYSRPVSSSDGTSDIGRVEGSCIIVCGSTQSRPLQCGVEPSFMSTDLYDGVVTADTWERALAEEYAKSPHRVLLAVRDRHRTGRDVAVHLRRIMAHAVRTLVGVHTPDHLIIEGGATAYSIFEALGWGSYQMIGEIAPGVVSLRSAGGTLVTMKPGSYPWGRLRP